MNGRDVGRDRGHFFINVFVYWSDARQQLAKLKSIFPNSTHEKGVVDVGCKNNTFESSYVFFSSLLNLFVDRGDRKNRGWDLGFVDFRAVSWNLSMTRFVPEPHIAILMKHGSTVKTRWDWETQS